LKYDFDMKRVHEYTAFFETNERGGYTVTVPALPGLVTEGKDLDNARDMAKDAIRCYVEGLEKAKQPMPVQREIPQVLPARVGDFRSRFGRR
jgi:predicted RNase H-like HicB family nuclease